MEEEYVEYIEEAPEQQEQQMEPIDDGDIISRRLKRMLPEENELDTEEMIRQMLE